MLLMVMLTRHRCIKPFSLICGSRTLTLDKPRVMGILNVTPDSFSDGGRYAIPDAALRHAEQMLAEGADLIDVGGESTRPGAVPVSAQQELDRVIPVVEAITARLDTIVSIDTSKPAVMQAAAAAGVGLINDIRALREPDAMAVAAELELPVCLMHMQGAPATMQASPHYVQIVDEVMAFLKERTQAAVEAGIAVSQILWDPGFGFGKDFTHNMNLLKGLSALTRQAPVLIGLSRKRMIAELLGDSSIDRTQASVMAAMLCVQKGARIIRTHDVEPTVHSLAVLAGAAQTESGSPLN